MKFHAIVILLFSFVSAAQAQTLFSIDKEQVSVNEFLSIYKKNNNKADFSEKSLKEYLDLYSLFKMKLNEAKSKKIDTISNLDEEFKTYSNQLTQGYFVDKDYMNTIMQNLYERTKKDRRVAHILIKIPQNAKPEDTLKAYNTILEIKNKIKSKEDFFQQAAEKSEDPNAKDTKGIIGFINIFMTFPTFEDMAYSTSLLKVSDIVKSPFGYHIILPIEERDARGKVSVAHIYTTDKTEEDKKNKIAEKKIMEAFKVIQSKKMTFDSAVKKYTEDNASLNTGGVLPLFGINEMVSEFEENSFALTQIGSMSKPFKSPFGWHIVKLLKKVDRPNFEEAKPWMKEKLDKDERVLNSKQLATKTIKEKYHYKEFNENFEELNKTISENQFEKKGWKLSQIKSPKTLIQLDEAIFTQNDFIEYVQNKYSNITAPKKEEIIKPLFENYKEFCINEYAQNRLKKENPEYATLIQEYQNGLMIFELMDREIWKKANKDTVEQKKLYEINKSKYLYKERVKSFVFKAKEASIVSKIKNELTSSPSSNLSDIDKRLKQSIDSNNFYSFEKIYEKGDLDILDKNEWIPNKMIEDYSKDQNMYTIYKLIEILPIATKPYNEVKGRVANEYQKIVEEKWVQYLKNKYKLTVNQDILKSLIK
jgi:peptidyl-prolyl cis-trans isomerase SurA